MEYDSYAHARLTELDTRITRTSLAARRGRKLRALRLEERVVVLEKTLIGLLEYLLAADVVDQRQLIAVLKNLETADVNKDGKVDSKDLQKKFGVEATKVRKRLKNAKRALYKRGKPS